MATWLGQINARVSLCGTAQMATETLAHELPDLVLLDVDLPDVNGYAIARLMRQDPRLGQLIKRIGLPTAATTPR
jgi:CheY-like chemotaxis protein